MALPYIDKEYDKEVVKAYVKSLIDEELSNGPGPSIEEESDGLFRDDTLLRLEIERITAGGKLASIDVERLRLEPPKPQLAKTNLERAWLHSVQNAEAQLEHQHSRLVNLELMNKFGANAWLLHNFQLEAIIKLMKEELTHQKTYLQNLNKERKTEQLRVGLVLQELESRWGQAIDRSLRVDVACQMLEDEIARLQSNET
ncbi:Pre-mRNA-splicing factor SPF27 [Blyttiomyces sp. JEL0837]|nr:Pre-mRNA-splicing factor SPF27 [Blyttiomyces sp. JEL0837]